MADLFKAPLFGSSEWTGTTKVNFNIKRSEKKNESNSSINNNLDIPDTKFNRKVPWQRFYEKRDCHLLSMKSFYQILNCQWILRINLFEKFHQEAPLVRTQQLWQEEAALLVHGRRDVRHEPALHLLCAGGE